VSDWKINTNQALGLPDTGDIRLSLTSGLASAQQSGWGERFANARLDALFRRTSTSLSFQLKTGLESFRNSLESFAWPVDNPVFNGRLVTSDNDSLSEYADVNIRAQGDAVRYYKFFSRGWDENAPVGLDADEYSFDVELGDSSESFSLTVGADWTEGDLLTAIADALNNSELHVQAEVVKQNTAGVVVPDLRATGTSLLIAVNAGSAAQDLKLRDTQGHMLSHVDLEAVNVPTDPASEQDYTFFSGRPGKPTVFVSSTFDPGATTTISAGSHTINWSMGTDSGSFTFAITEGDTWEDVLDKVANAAGGSAQNRFSAEVRTYEMPSELVAGETIEGIGLYFEALSPKLGDRLSFTAGDSGGAMGTLGFATAQPGSDSSLHVGGDRYERAAGPISLDYGRVSVEVKQSFAETIPMSVVQPLEQMQQALSDVVTSFNSVYSLMLDNAELLREGLSEQWWEPYAEDRVDADFAGIKEGAGDFLWLSHDDFYTALGSDSERVQSTLLDEEEGLLPKWQRLASDTLDAGVSSLLINQESITDPIYGKPSSRTELELERSNQLLDVVESTGSGMDDFLGGGGLVNRKG